MEEIVKALIKLCLGVTPNQEFAAAAVTIASFAYRHLAKRQNQFNQEMAVNIKRLEVLRAIDNDYGLPLVSELVDEYEKMGGNHYVHALFEKYKEKKMEEIEV